MQQITLRVTGMSCMGCVNSVRQMLTALAGVERVEVDLASGLAHIDFDPGQVGPAELRAVLEAGGYPVSD